jgi:hypothetical protein
MLERVSSFVGARVRVDRADVELRVTRIARQLELGRVDLPALCELARRAGKQRLAARLDRLAVLS